MDEIKQKIECPKCGASISIDDVLTHQIGKKIKKEIEDENRSKEAEITKGKRELEEGQIKFEESQKNAQIEINRKVAEKLNTEKLNLWKQAKIEAEKEKVGEIKILEEQVKDKDEKLKLANQNELELRKEKQKLKDDKNAFELEKTRQLDEERKKIEEEASKKATEAQQSKIDQMAKQISDATKKNEELKRKLEQGSQQTQGEVQEIKLEELLRAEFKYDDILPVPKGVTGPDVIQTVKTKSGTECGKIIWESKKTKNWIEGWIQKIKDNQRLVKADIAVIVSSVLPEGVQSISLREGIWVCDIKLAISIATALRQTLEAISREKIMSVGKNEKMEILYAYLMGTEFKQRIETIVETFSSMKSSLDKEKIYFEKSWAEKEKQIQKVVKNTVGIYGDLSGLVTLPQIKTLELEEEAENK